MLFCPPDRKEVFLIVESTIVSVLLLAFSLVFCFTRAHRGTRTTSTAWLVQGTYSPSCFYGLLLTCLGGILAWMNFHIHSRSNVLLWLVDFIRETPTVLPRGVWIVFWITCLLMSLTTGGFQSLERRFQIRQIVARKLYHLLAVVMFLPVTLLDPDFMQLSYAVAFAGLVLAEVVRVLQVPPFGALIQRYVDQVRLVYLR